MKKCSKCGKIKKLSEFSKHKHCKFGVRPDCKTCHNKSKREYNKSKIGLIKQIYSNQCKRSDRKGWKSPGYSLDELCEWCFKQQKFHKLYDKWKNSNYHKWKVPSCDRLNDYKPYTLQNLKIVAWKENFNKYQKDRIDGKNNKQNKKIGQFAKSGELISEFQSVHFASRETQIWQANISACANGRVKSAGGFIWKFI